MMGGTPGKPLAQSVLDAIIDFDDDMVKWAGAELPIEHDKDARAFWKALYASGKHQLIARSAVEALSISTSNAAAERAFSVLTNRSSSNKLRGKKGYARANLMLGADRYYVSLMHRDTVSHIAGVDVAELHKMMVPAAAVCAGVTDSDSDTSDADESGPDCDEADLVADC